MQFAIFSKHFISYSLSELPSIVKQAGCAALDLAVRAGGHVEPADVPHALVEAVRTLRAGDVSVAMLTTDITGAHEPKAEAIIAEAGRIGIRDVKLGYWPRDESQSLRAQLDHAQQTLGELEYLAQSHGVRICLHTHSGPYLTAAANNIYRLLEKCDPEFVGAYIDPAHLIMESGDDGWSHGIDLLHQYLAVVAAKAVRYEPDSRTSDAPSDFRVVPLAYGNVPWRKVFDHLQAVNWDGVVSFHSEYRGWASWRELTGHELIAQTRADIDYLTPITTAAGYVVE